MKRVLSLTLVLVCFVLLLAGCGDKAKTETVTVTIVDKNGEAVLALKEVKAKDLDGDDKITIFEALKAAHATCPNGGKDGFAAEETQYGLSMTKLWGEENGGSFGYYVNNEMPMSLTEEVKTDDQIVAYFYLYGQMETFCYFEPQVKTVKKGETVTLTLTAFAFDENWTPVPTPVESATITVNGTAVEAKTDAEGKITLTLDKGVNVISASSDALNLVPPIAKITVK